MLRSNKIFCNVQVLECVYEILLFLNCLLPLWVFPFQKPSWNLAKEEARLKPSSLIEGAMMAEL